jgi:hypothetical protein
VRPHFFENHPPSIIPHSSFIIHHPSFIIHHSSKIMSPAAQQLLVLLLGAAVLHGIYLSALIFFKNKNIEEGRLLGLALLSVSAYLLNYLLFFEWYHPVLSQLPGGVVSMGFSWWAAVFTFL